MASFVLRHRLTHTILSGYRVLAASPDEVIAANRNLSSSGSEYRYIADLPSVTHPARQAAALQVQA